jgi:hypothetical protein
MIGNSKVQPPCAAPASKLKHWLVTAHEESCEDETFYVLGRSALQVENTVKARLRRKDKGVLLPLDEIYVTMIAELPGPPVRIYTESGVVVSPKPINEIKS